MRIFLSPILHDASLELELIGIDQLCINGDVFEFDSMQDGDIILSGVIPSEWIIGPVQRINGEINLTINLPHGSNPEKYQSFPEEIVVDEIGIIDIPSNTRIEVEYQEVEGGVEMTKTLYRWRQEPQVTVIFIPNEEPDDESDSVETEA